MSRVLAALTVVAATVALSVMLFVIRPNVIVVAPWPAVPMTTPAVTISPVSVDQLEQAVISSISRLENPFQSGPWELPELE